MRNRRLRVDTDRLRLLDGTIIRVKVDIATMAYPEPTRPPLLIGNDLEGNLGLGFFREPRMAQKWRLKRRLWMW